MFVKTKMTCSPITVAYDATIPDAQELMHIHSIKHLPVLKHGKLVGIVTGEDIAKASPSMATSLSFGEITYLLGKTKIANVMTHNPITISPDALLEEAATLMRDKDISFLPVMSGDTLVGVITQSDIFDAFLELQGARDAGVRYTFEVDNHPGKVLQLTEIINRFGGNITTVAVYRHADPTKRYILVGVTDADPDLLAKAFTDGGFPIAHQSAND